MKSKNYLSPQARFQACLDSVSRCCTLPGAVEHAHLSTWSTNRKRPAASEFGGGGGAWGLAVWARADQVKGAWARVVWGWAEAQGSVAGRARAASGWVEAQGSVAVGGGRARAASGWEGAATGCTHRKQLVSACALL